MRMHSLARLQSRARRVLLAAALIAGCTDEDILAPPPAPGILVARIRDDFGTPVTDATVEVQDPSGAISRVRTTSSGSIIVRNTQAGVHDVLTTHPAFDDDETSVVVPAGDTAFIDISLTPQSLPSAGLFASRIISRTTTSAVFELDLFVSDRSANAVSGLTGAAFSISDFTVNTTTYRFAQQTSAPVAQTSAGAYSALLTIDQSSSMIGNDGNGSRFQAAKVFLGAVSGGDQVWLNAFASGGLLPFEITQYGNGFTTAGTTFFSAINALTGLVSGGTPLYKAVYAATNSVRTSAPTANRAVVVFTDGEDTQGGVTLEQAITNAIQGNVKLFPVALGSGTDMLVLGEMANRTGGAVMHASDARQLVSLFGSLGGVLRRSVPIYRTRWQVTRSAGTFGPGAAFSTSVRITTNAGALVAPVYVRIP